MKKKNRISFSIRTNLTATRAEEKTSTYKNWGKECAVLWIYSHECDTRTERSWIQLINSRLKLVKNGNQIDFE